MEIPGRSCPLAYRYQPEALAQPTRLEADTLYVVGGLYGNPAALRALLERADHEPSGPPTIVFNGDVHWLNVDPDDFQAISETVPAHHGIKGNVEAELASGEGAGCGCALGSSTATRNPWPAGGWPWRPWNPATHSCAARSAGMVSQPPPPTCSIDSTGPRSPCSPAPTPACRMPRT